MGRKSRRVILIWREHFFDPSHHGILTTSKNKLQIVVLRHQTDPEMTLGFLTQVGTDVRNVTDSDRRNSS
jgi:hypothetical protein